MLLSAAGPAVAARLAPIVPIEEYDAAFSELRTQVQANDLVFIHASGREGTDFYMRTRGGLLAPVIYGNIGWPCCAREWRHPSTESPSLVADDLVPRLPAHFTGRLWLLYTSRPEHYYGYSFDPREAMIQALADAGCLPSRVAEFRGVVVRAFNCHLRG